MKHRGTTSNVGRHDEEVLDALLQDAVTTIVNPLPAQSRIIRQLEELRRRLTENRLQLAVLGQFKRGKSTLLNALLGTAIVPTAVVPLTAIPTFVRAGANPFVRSIFLSGNEETFAASQPRELATQVARLVTEEANPNNRLGLDRVEIEIAAPLLERGVVMIDTPGVGSTFRHNTERAEAVLPECDAALFVVSPDPPITEVEVAYLTQVRAAVARLIIVLNKADTVDAQELTTLLDFLRRAISEQTDVAATTPIFTVSARNALRAKLGDDAAALASSGLPALEAYLGDFLAHQKRATLYEAIARKAKALTADLLMQTELRLQALRLPLDELDRRLAMFDESIVRLDQERRTVHDLLDGDRRRFLPWRRLGGVFCSTKS